MCCLGLGCAVKVGVAPAEECECETLATSASSSAQCIGASNAAPSPAMLRAWRCYDALLGLGCAVKAGVASAEHFETLATGTPSFCALHLGARLSICHDLPFALSELFLMIRIPKRCCSS